MIVQKVSRHPAISIVMPVYNAGKYVSEAIRSILSQSFGDFEFIIVNDGSNDNSLEVISSFRDNRIRIINCEINTGNYPARNKGNAIAKGKYICVMDADDISNQNRLKSQFQYMEAYPEIGISGGAFRFIGKEENIVFREIEHENIKVMLLRGFCLYHCSLIYKQSFVKRFKLRYNESYKLAADYDFVVRGIRHFKVTNATYDTFYYRVHQEQNSKNYRSIQYTNVDKIRMKQLNYLGLYPSSNEFKLHLNLLNLKPIELFEKNNVFAWIQKLLKANNLKKYYDNEKLSTFFEALYSNQTILNPSVKPIISIK